MSRSVSPEQFAVNRANAARSTGPCTPQRKHRSAQKARKHGFTASSFAVVCLERVALAQQTTLRAARLGSGFFINYLNESFDTNGESLLLRNSQLGASFALLLRYQAQAERQHRRAIEEFDLLKAPREELQNEIHMTGMLATPRNENS